VNTDIRLRLSFRSHPKTKKLKLKLGPEAVLSFIWLLMFAAESRSDGDLVGLDEEDLALAGDWPGDPKEFVDVLVAVGYLDVIEDGWRIHDWRDNNPWAAGAKERSEKARKAAEARWSDPGPPTKKQAHRPESDAPSMGRAKPRAESGNAPSPSPSPKNKQRGPIVDLPDWINREIWLEYEQHRKELRHPATPTAARRIIAKLERFKDDHDVDPNEAIELAIERNWRGVFPERIVEDRKDEGRQNRRPGNRETASSRRQSAADRKRVQIAAIR
jgi:hypothetical protein